MTDTGEASLAARWLEAVRNPAILTELDAIYAYVMAAIESKRPRCDSSGRCCNFDAYGHRLYVTGLEAAYTVARLGEHGRELTAQAVADARTNGTCPFLDGKLCAVHEIKPLGCRVYFCDPAASGWMEDLSERMLRELRAVHERHGIEYRYGEWRSMLEMFVQP